MIASTTGAAPQADTIPMTAEDAGSVVAMAGAWLGEAERALDAGDHEGALATLAYAVAALDALTGETESGTTQTGLGTRLLASYRALVDAKRRDLDEELAAPVPTFAMSALSASQPAA